MDPYPTRGSIPAAQYGKALGNAAAVPQQPRSNPDTRDHPEQKKMVVLRGGLFPDLESTQWEASLKNAKQPSFIICSIRSFWLQVPSFPRARPRMCRSEVWVAALNLIEAHSHTLSIQ